LPIVPTSTHSTIRAALDPWLGTGHDVCVIRSRRVATSPISAALVDSPFRVTDVSVGRTMTEELEAAHPDVVIVDASTGDYDALRLCRDVHESSRAPIVAVLPADRAGEDALAIDLLDAGALAIVVAGISPSRLLAHVRAALRASPAQHAPPVLTVGDVVIDLDAHFLSIDGALVNCPPLLFSLLAARGACQHAEQGHDPRDAPRHGVGRRTRNRRHPASSRRGQPPAPRPRSGPAAPAPGDRFAHRLSTRRRLNTHPRLQG